MSWNVVQKSGRATTNAELEIVARQKDAQKEALGTLKICLTLASTILSGLPIQAPKAAVDTIKQMIVDFEARH